MKAYATGTMVCIILSVFVGRLFAGVVAGPITNSFNGHIYVVIGPESWSQAQTEAHGLGGHLATIRSGYENNWVVSNILVNFSSSGGPNLYSLPVWIGLYDPDQNDGGGPGSQHAADFVWDSSETNGYRNWNPNEPSNTGNLEYYTAINWHFAAGQSSTRGTWNDAPLDGSTGSSGTSSGPYYGLVEFGTGVPPLPTAPGAFYGPVTSSVNGHEYFILPPNNWSNAQAAAQSLGGNLATIRSQAEDLWIVTNLLVDLSPYAGGTNLSDLPLWIGLYDPERNDGAGPTSQHAANFIWVSGETAAYRNWNPPTSEPNNQNNNEYFTAINWHFAQGETTDQSVWDDTPFDGTSGLGGTTDGPYYGIAEVIPGVANVLTVSLSGSVLTITPPLNSSNAVIQSTTSLSPPILWTPVWTNSGTGPYTITVGPGNMFFRLAY